MTRNTILFAPIEREQLTIREAAYMCGESETGFRELVASGYYPKPIVNRPRRGKRWNRKALQRRLDEISNQGKISNSELNLDEVFGIGR